MRSDKKLTINFKVIGQPQGKSRPRFVNGHAYTPKETKEYEANIGKAYIIAAKGYCFKDKPVSLKIVVYLRRTKSNKREFATTKPDVDNIIKAVFDGLNGIAFDDDKQVVDITACKLYCDNINDIPYIAVELTDEK